MSLLSKLTESYNDTFLSELSHTSVELVMRLRSRTFDMYYKIKPPNVNAGIRDLEGGLDLDAAI